MTSSADRRRRDAILRRTEKCEVINLTPTRPKDAQAKLSQRCTANGEPHLHAGHVMCWTHRKAYENGRTLTFVMGGGALSAFFPPRAVDDNEDKKP